jgi:hypothetical protein
LLRDRGIPYGHPTSVQTRMPMIKMLYAFNYGVLMKLNLLKFLFLIMSFSASADFFTGNNLNNYIKNTESNFKQGLFSGYVIGVVDTGNDILFCTPNGATAGQLSAVVKKYLQQNPELWNKGASELVINSLAKAYPCPK